MAEVAIRNMTRRPAPRFAYEVAAASILPTWEVSLVFVGRARATSLNRTLRNKDYVPNVLSYAVGKRSGEVVICLDVAKKQAPDYKMSYRDFVLFLFIHGLMHLKGRAHGPTMEKEERAHLARLLTIRTKNGPTQNRNRNRHRHAPNKGRRR